MSNEIEVINLPPFDSTKQAMAYLNEKIKKYSEDERMAINNMAFIIDDIEYQSSSFQFGIDVFIDDAGVSTYLAFRLNDLDNSGILKASALSAEGETPYEAIGNLCDKLNQLQASFEK